MSIGPAVTYVVQSDVWLDGRGPQQTGTDPHPLSTSPCVRVRRGTCVMISPADAVTATRYGGFGNLARLDMTTAGDHSSKAALAN